MTTSKSQIKKINDLWANGERNKASIMKAVGVSRKTLLKHLKQEVPVQKTIPSGCANTAQEQKPMQATQSPDQLTNETTQPRAWTWAEVDEITRPGPVAEPFFHDPLFDNLSPSPWEQEQQMQPPQYQYPEENPQYSLIKDEITWLKEELTTLKEENRRISEEILRNNKTQQSQIKNEQVDTQNLQPQQQNIESDPDKATPVIEKIKPVLSTVDSTSPKPEETKNQNISTSFKPTTKINITEPDGKQHTAEVNPEELIHPTIEKEKKKWEEPVKKTASKEYNISEIAASKNDTTNLQERQNTEVTPAVALKETAPIEEKEETELDFFEILSHPAVNVLVNIGARHLRSHWDNKPIRAHPLDQRDNINLTNYQYASIRKSMMLQQLKKEANERYRQQNYTVTYYINW